MNQPPATLTPNPPAEKPRTKAAPGSRPCEECGAPMDRRQRYCINCAARRGDVANPASRYFAAASRTRRAAADPAGRRPPADATNGARTAAVFFFVLLPIAVAVGVIVGRSGSDSDTDKVLAALRDGSIAPAAATADTATAGSSKTVSDSLLTSDFTLDKGFTVKIGALPIDATDQAAADDAKSKAEDKGAEDVGIINPGDFTTDPDQGQDDYILYSGEFSDRGAAAKTLAGLKKDFPDAEVIAVESGGDAAPGKTDDIGKVVAKTEHGTVHEVTAEAPSEEQVAHDTEIVNDIANQTGDDYTDAQQQLPDVTVVGGNPEDAPPLPTGAGD